MCLLILNLLAKGSNRMKALTIRESMNFLPSNQQWLSKYAVTA